MNERSSRQQVDAPLRRMAILGGSTPFTVSLIDALASASKRLEPMTIVINGRRPGAIQLMTSYTDRVLGQMGWRVTSSSDLDESLYGCDLVVHQIRYGGLHERSVGELLAAKLDVPTDETLGPAALRTGIRMVPSLQRLSTSLQTNCPNAIVLNLTNPLSSSTAIIQAGFDNRVLGVCELPLYTMTSACRVLKVPPGSVGWSYSGLNHRGFIHRLSYRGRDLLRELVRALNTTTIGGITGQEIEELKALPLKYFVLMRTGGRGPKESRSLYLTELRNRVTDELRANPGISPVSLAERDPNWYSDALVPLIVALNSKEGEELIVNHAHADGLVREELAHVSNSGIRPMSAEPVPIGAARWIERFELHERCVLQACLDPSLHAVMMAMEADPLIVPAKARASAKALVQTLSLPMEGQARQAHDPAILTM